MRYPTAAFAEPMASCSTGYAEMSEQCPEPDDDAETKAVAHWNTNPEPSNELPTPHASGLWKYDPDKDNRSAMDACLLVRFDLSGIMAQTPQPILAVWS